MLVLLLFVLFIVYLGTQSPQSGVILGTIMVIATIAAALDYRSHYRKLGIAQSCPSCHTWYAERIVSRDELGRKGRYETITRFDHTTGNIYDTSSSNPSDWKTMDVNYTTRRREQVHMTYVTYLNHLRCPYCGFRWNKVSVSKFEG
jgi:hypothetical protein